MKVGELLEKIRSEKSAVLEVVEIFLAFAVLCGVIVFAVNMATVFFARDWSDVSIMYEFISAVLLILLGFEVARLIVIPSLKVVMELMMLIVARKMLYPDAGSLDLLLCAIAFCLIVATYYLYELKPLKSLDDLRK